MHVIVDTPPQTTGSWHALAELTRHRLLHTPPTSTAHIFELWYHRIIALTKHRSTFAQARAETRRLMAVLGDGVAETAEETRKQQQSARPTTTLPRVPFALRVVMALVPWIAGGAALETVEMLYRLLYLCRVVCSSNAAERSSVHVTLSWIMATSNDCRNIRWAALTNG